MKKIIAILAVVLAAGGGYAFYQTSKSKKEIVQATSKPYESKSLGLQLKLNATNESPQGLMDVSLAVPGGSLKTDLSFIPEISFTKAELKAHLWKPNTLILLIPEGKIKDLIEVKNISIPLKSDGSFEKVEIESMTVAKHSTVFALNKIKLEAGKFEGTYPDESSVDVESVTFQEPSMKEKFVWGPWSVQTKTSKEDKLRKFESVLKIGGFKFSPDAVTVDVQPLSLKVKGNSTEMPAADSIKFRQQMIESVAGLLQKFLNRASSRDAALSGAQASQEIKQVIAEVQTFLTRFNATPAVIEFEQGGFSVSMMGKPLFKLDPISIQGKSEISNNVYKSEMTGEFKGLQISPPTQEEFQMNGIHLKGNSTYTVNSYAEYLQLVFNYYLKTVDVYLSAMDRRDLSAPKIDPEAMQVALMSSAISIYPNTFQFEIKVDKLGYTDRKGKIEHKDIELGVQFEKEKLQYSIKSNFDHDYLLDRDLAFIKQIKNGKLEWKFAVNFPWEKFIQWARTTAQSASTGFTMVQFVQQMMTLFDNFKTGYEVKAVLDLGADQFAGEFNSSAGVELSKVLKTTDGRWVWEVMVENKKKIMSAYENGGTPNYEEMRQVENKVMTDMVQQAFANGTGEATLKINRLNKIKDIFTQMNPGRNWDQEVIPVLSQFTQLDMQNNALNVKIELKNGQVLLNGQANPLIDAEVQKLKAGQF